MSIKVVKSRGKSKIIKSFIDYRKVLTKSKPYKALLVSLKKRRARNNQGRITTRFRANPVHRRLYRLVDFSRLSKIDIPARVETIEYDPNRTAFIMLVCYQDGERKYHLAPEGIKIGDRIVCSENGEINIGNRVPLKNINPGTEIFEIEIFPGSGGKLIRSAGSFGTMLGIEGDYAIIKLPSGEIRKIHKNCYATIGRVSNPDHQNLTIGKAGRSYWKGWRPHVRGSAMNARDHPYGGGEGKTTRGMRKPKDPWGNVTGGRKTRSPRKPSNRFILQRRPKKK